MASTIVTRCVLSLDLSLFIFRLCLCKCWPWSKDTWGRGSHTDSFRGALPLSWSLIRWAHTQHVPLMSSAWLALPPEIKDGWGAAVLMERRVERVRRWWWWRGGCYKKVGGNGWRVRVWLWGNGRRGDILRPLCACVGESHHPATSPALGHWPLCRIHIKNSGPVKMTPETNPVTSSALKWPLVDMARTVCHFGLRCGVLCACGQYLYASECKVGCGVCLSGKRGVACGIENTAGLLWLWSLMLESHCLHDTTGVPICPQSCLL